MFSFFDFLLGISSWIFVTTERRLKGNQWSIEYRSTRKRFRHRWAVLNSSDFDDIKDGRPIGLAICSGCCCCNCHLLECHSMRLCLWRHFRHQRQQGSPTAHAPIQSLLQRLLGNSDDKGKLLIHLYHLWWGRSIDSHSTFNIFTLSWFFQYNILLSLLAQAASFIGGQNVVTWAIL